MKQILQTHLGKALLCLLMVVLGGSNAWGETSTYTKVTATPSDWSGTYVIVADLTETNGQIFTGQNASNTYGGNNGVTISNGSVTGDYSAYEVEVEASGTSGDYYSIKHVKSSKYLGWTSNNTLAFSTTAPTSDSYRWSLSTSSILNAKDNTRKLQYNSGSPRFACYTSSQKVAYLYKKVETTTSIATPTFSVEEGTYTSTQSVELACATDGATIYYTLNGSDPTVESTEYTFAISVSSTTTIKAIAVKDGMDNSSVASATYTIVSLDHAGTEADPYTVADARTLLTAAPSTTFENVYVSGIISQVDSYNSTYKSITYWISDDGTKTDQFEVYSGKGLNGADFSSKDDLIVGSEVIVKGNIKKYNSTFEFDVNSQIVSLAVPTYPIINAAATLNLEYDATSGEITYTIDNPTDATLTAVLTTGDWISNVTVDAVNNKVTFTATANEGDVDRTATITLSYTGAQDKVVTVTQKHYVVDYAELPFSYDGNGSGTLPVGLTQSGLGTYNSSPAMKFDTTGDELILKINERPGVLTFDIKNNSFSGGTFKVQTSVDGDTYTDLKVYSSITSTQNEEFTNLDANVRYIKWVYTNKVSGNVALGNIELAEYVYISPVINAESSVALEFDATSGEIPYTIKYPVDGVNLTATENADWISGINVTADKVTFTATANEGEARNATITLSYTGAEDKEVTVTQAAYVAPFENTTWTLATSITSGKHYIIVGMNDDDAYAMGAQSNNNRAAVGVDIEGETATVSSADVQEFVIYGPDAAGFYTIYDGTGYLYAVSSSSNHLKTEATVDDNGKWSIVFDGNNKAAIKAQGTNTHNWMLFNTSGLFSCYANTSNSVNDNIYLYEKQGEATPEESVTVGSAGYTTYVTQNPVSFPTGVIGYVVTEVGETSMHLEEVTDAPAREPLVIKANAGTYTLGKNFSTGYSSVCTGETKNLLKASDGNVSGGATIFALALKGENVGFFPVSSSIKVPAGKAYLEVAGGSVKGFIFDFGATGIAEPKAESTNAPIYNLAGQRVSRVEKGIYIQNGRKFFVK